MNAKMYASICFLCEELCMKFGLVSYILTPCLVVEIQRSVVAKIF